MAETTRRDILRAGLVGIAGAAVGAATGSCGGPVDTLAAESLTPGRAKGLRVRDYGATGLKVSEIGFGGFPIRDPQVLHYAIDRGITYIDTSDDYRGGASEEVIGRVMKTRRKEVVLATKWHPWAKTTKAEMLSVLEGCLRRLQTDYLDVIQVHQVGRASGGEGIERLRNPDLFEAFETAKKQGKVGYLGVTGHDGDLMEVMKYALGTGKFSTILCRYNFLDYPGQPDLYRKARAQGVAGIAMKTLAGAKRMDLDRFRKAGVTSTYAQSALRWVLSNPDVSTAIISIVSREQVDEYVGAADFELGRADHSILREYARQHDREVCRFCNECEPACPYDVKVADVLRYGMYAREYGLPEEGRALYAAMAPGRNASACLGCPAPCVPACPSGLPVSRLLVSVHDSLRS